MGITPENAIAKLNRYHELQQLNAKYDYYVLTGQPHDIAQSVALEWELKELEYALMEAGIFRDEVDEVVTRAGRKT